MFSAFTAVAFTWRLWVVLSVAVGSVVGVDRGIYKEAAVKAAAAEYAAFAGFVISREAAYTKVEVTPREAELPARFAQEFSNRALINSI